MSFVHELIKIISNNFKLKHTIAKSPSSHRGSASFGVLGRSSAPRVQKTAAPRQLGAIDPVLPESAEKLMGRPIRFGAAALNMHGSARLSVVVL